MSVMSFDYGGVSGAISESGYLDNGLGESLGGVGGTLFVPLDLPENTLRTGLSEHWDMDETTGNRVGSEGNYDLVPTGTVSYVTGKISNAVDFNGAGRIEVSDGTPALWGPLFTLSLWYKPDAAVPAGIETIASIANGTSSTTWWLQHDTDGEIRWRVGNGTTLKGIITTGGAKLDATKFNHIVCQFSDAGDMVRLRINDGGWIYDFSTDISMQTPLRDLSVGALDAGGQAASGAVDEMAIWPILIPDSDIAWLWNGGAAYAYSNWLPVASVTRRIFIIS